MGYIRKKTLDKTKLVEKLVKTVKASDGRDLIIESIIKDDEIIFKVKQKKTG